MKKKTFWSEVICILVIVSLMLCAASAVVKRKFSDEEYRTFFDRASEYDVLFYGPSIVHYSITPMELWKDYGITSYNMGNDSERLTMTYYDILNSLDHCTPKVIVVDLSGMCWAGTTRDNTLKDHTFIDAVPMSENKIKEVVDVFDRSEYAEYLFPFTLYHSRWNELTKDDFQPDYHNVLYGTKIVGGILPADPPVPGDEKESRYGEVEKEGIVIDRIIDLCRERGVKLLFTYLPSPGRGGDQKLRRYCKDFLEKRDAEFIDMLHMDIVDYSRDYFDEGHLNFFGAHKVTDYLGKTLKEKYDVPDHRQDAGISRTWNSDYAEYEKQVDEFMEEHLDAYEKGQNEKPDVVVE